MQDFVIDAFAYSQQAVQRSGSLKVADLPRLSEDCANTEGMLAWSLAGDVNEYGHARLTLTVKGEVNLVCQRCLTPYAFEIDSESVLILAKNDDEADEIEDLLDDDEIDVVVGGKSLDIKDLIEDEALLAIPQSPKHAVCPDVGLASAASTATQDGENGKKESPFAVLKKLSGRT